MENVNDGIIDLLEKIYFKYKDNREGDVASYIPELMNVDPNLFAVSITDLSGKTISFGDYNTKFAIQSITKPFVFGDALQTHGEEKTRKKVGVEPTGEPFDSISRVDNQLKLPYNPLVNSGAIVMTNLIPGKSSVEKYVHLKTMLEKYIGHEVDMDVKIYESEKTTGHRNRSIGHLMLHFGMIDNQVEETLDLYFKQCSFKVDTVDLSVMAATLANYGINPINLNQAIESKYVKKILTLMLSCGMYTYAGEWAYEIGIPAKSGVCGGILAVIPGKMGIGVYSPLLDQHGNSIKGKLVCKDLSETLNLHSFDSTMFK